MSQRVGGCEGRMGRMEVQLRDLVGKKGGRRGLPGMAAAVIWGLSRGTSRKWLADMDSNHD